MGDKIPRLRWQGPRFSRIQVLRDGRRYVQVVHDPRPISHSKPLVEAFGPSTTHSLEAARLFVHDAWVLGRLARQAKSDRERLRLRKEFRGRLSKKALDLILPAP